MSSNRVIIAAAGAGKTTYLVNEAGGKTNRKIAIVTFTDNNTEEIRQKFIKIHGCVPKWVTIIPWFSFLLKHMIRPYQDSAIYDGVIKGILMVNGVSKKGTNRNDKIHYFHEDKIYSDKIAEFAHKCNEKSNNAVMHRLSLIFDEIYIDEIQDLAGWDLEILKLLFSSEIDILLVGDYRQSTFHTNNSAKNKKAKNESLLTWLYSLEKEFNLTIDTDSLNENYRCPKVVCNLADKLFPSQKAVVCNNITSTDDHFGIFYVNESCIDSYLEMYQPLQLRYDAKTNLNENFQFLTYGSSKGLTVDRVLIYPTKNIKEWILDNKKDLSATIRCKFYVALTRARISVGIVENSKSFSEGEIYKSFD